MHNGQPTGPQGPGTTEDGAYINIGDQDSFARQPGAQFFIPTEDEWYKAAYYDPNKGGLGVPGYWEYPTMSDTAPSNDLINPDPGNNATFYVISPDFTIGPPYDRTEVGAHENSGGAYGTFDQGGNVWEWNETVISTDDRGRRGGSWINIADILAASFRSRGPPTDVHYFYGFRLASPIPEPATMSLFGIAAAALLRRRPLRG